MSMNNILIVAYYYLPWNMKGYRALWLSKVKKCLAIELAIDRIME